MILRKKDPSTIAEKEPGRQKNGAGRIRTYARGSQQISSMLFGSPEQISSLLPCRSATAPCCRCYLCAEYMQDFLCLGWYVFPTTAESLDRFLCVRPCLPLTLEYLIIAHPAIGPHRLNTRTRCAPRSQRDFHHLLTRPAAGRSKAMRRRLPWEPDRVRAVSEAGMCKMHM